MSIDFEKALGLHGQALRLRAERTKILAGNIANESTPGYQARDIDFSASLRQAMASDAADGGLRLDTDSAEALYREGADKARERWGPDHAFVLGAQAALADLCVRRGDLDGAARLYEELLPRLGAFPAHHPLVAGARYGYSLTFERAGKRRQLALVELVDDGTRIEL